MRVTSTVPRRAAGAFDGLDAPGGPVGLDAALAALKNDPVAGDRIAHWAVLPAREGRYAPFPAWLDHRLVRGLSARGIDRLYSHQAEALEAVRAGRDVVVVTPTASGKTLCYNLPVLQGILDRPEARAIYLFPTKALAQDQLSEVHDFVTLLGLDIKTFTYDGDTPPTARRAVRAAGHIVITNPDMLHTGILPHHTRWVKLFENLSYVVVDEIHNYRGVLGSHVANVIRRLRRVTSFYGSSPRFICSSATIANPRELASELTGTGMTLIDQNGAPAGRKHFIFYNPPVVNRELGIRRSAVLEAARLAETFLRREVPTIVFARSRVTTEVLLSYVKEALGEPAGREDAGRPSRVRGYRGGYLPGTRREIERGLRSGELLGVVSTNALELGIDIGSLQAAVMTGYPGTIASTWQQAGRAGRRLDESVACLVATSSPLDQFLVSRPDYLLTRSPETALIDPDNPLIRAEHVKCAAFELPFEDGETFGRDERLPTARILGELERSGILRHAGGRWHWSAESFPAEEVSLRSAAADNFVVIDTTHPQPRVLAEVDRFSAPMLIHEEAIYLHEGRQYHIDRLEWEEQKAYAHEVDVDHYTDANLAVQVKVLEVLERAEGGSAGRGIPGVARFHGEVSVTALATVFKKIRFHTHENVGWGRISLPEQTMHTEAAWLALSPTLTAGLATSEVQAGLVGLGTLLANIAPLHLMCDPRDIRAFTEVRSPFTYLPTVFLYDRYPGGVGLSRRLYDILPELWAAAGQLLECCPCEEGCPSCVGPAAEVGPAKPATARFLGGVAAGPPVEPGRAGSAP